jgi:hypothetical protein
LSIVDRFVCRREGHIPALEFKQPPQGITVTSYVTSCRRCGKVYEIVPEHAAADRSSEAMSPTEGTGSSES